MVDDDSISIEGCSLVEPGPALDGTSLDSGCTILLGGDSIGATVVGLSVDKAASDGETVGATEADASSGTLGVELTGIVDSVDSRVTEVGFDVEVCAVEAISLTISSVPLGPFGSSLISGLP